jgi:hypothetical protein
MSWGVEEDLPRTVHILTFNCISHLGSRYLGTLRSSNSDLRMYVGMRMLKYLPKVHVPTGWSRRWEAKELR